MDDERAIERITATLRAYLAARPGAADTQRGILEWWLAGVDPPPRPEQLAAALIRLAQRGRIRRDTLADGGEIWRATDR